jgi:YD repeat-containing protein
MAANMDIFQPTRSCKCYLHLCNKIKLPSTEQSKKTMFVLILVVCSLLLSLTQQAYAQTQTWWRANVGNIGPGPLGAWPSHGEACQVCLHDFSGGYNWTGTLTGSGNVYGCTFYRPRGATESNYESIQTGGCTIGANCYEGQSYLNGGFCAAPLKPYYKQSHEICIGNPIIVATGNKFQTETDYQSQTPFSLNFVRFYNSSSNVIDKGIGKKWRHGFSRQIVETNISQAHAARSNGQTFIFNFDGNVWVGDVDIPNALVETIDGNSVRTGWVYTDSKDNVETYNASGQLLSLTNRAGQSQTLTYDVTAIDGGDDNADTLDKVTGFGGEQMLFSYDSEQRITTMTDPEDNEYTYSYDAAGNLASATYPDNTPLDSLDNPVRTYHYENTSFPNHLTGLTDETGSRVTWAFDSEGRAISSSLDGGVDTSTLDYSIADQVTVTNPLGKDTTYHFTTLHEVKKVTQVEGHATTSCAGANQNYTYDANGYLASKMDWQGNVTNYVHDARGLETSRTEAVGTADERTITTQWHVDFRLPTKITAPDKITDFVYDTQGRLTSQTTHDVE